MHVRTPHRKRQKNVVEKQFLKNLLYFQAISKVERTPTPDISQPLFLFFNKKEKRAKQKSADARDKISDGGAGGERVAVIAARRSAFSDGGGNGAPARERGRNGEPRKARARARGLRFARARSGATPRAP